MIMHQDVITLGDGMMGGSFFFLWESLCFTTLLHEAYIFFGNWLHSSPYFGENYLTTLSLILYLKMKITIVSTPKGCRKY